MLYYDRHVRLEQAGIVGVSGNGFRIEEIVESDVPRPPRGYRDVVGPRRFTIGEKT